MTKTQSLAMAVVLLVELKPDGTVLELVLLLAMLFAVMELY